MSLLGTVDGTIDRRLLVNLRVDPDAAARVLPAPYEPLVVGGSALAGMCFIRMTHLRPRWLPRGAGLRTENVAHRIAVTWRERGRRRVGVWIPVRHTSSRLTVASGRRLFPAAHELADVTVDTTGGGLHLTAHDAWRHLLAEVDVAPVPDGALPAGSVFGSVGEAAAFFRQGSLGIAPGEPGPGADEDVVDLRVADWDLQPVHVRHARSTLLEDWWRLGVDAEWDAAFLMRGTACRWTTVAA